MKQNITIIAGGNGNSALIKALHNYNKEHQSFSQINSIVCMSDDGRSTGRLMQLYQEKWKILPPPGDVRRCLMALSSSSHKSQLSRIWEYRFIETDGDISDYNMGQFLEKITGLSLQMIEQKYQFQKKLSVDLYNHKLAVSDNLEGHGFGNFFMIALWEIFEYDYPRMVELLHEYLEVSEGKVYPVTYDEARIYAELQNGEKIMTQADITVPKKYHYVPIQHLGFHDHCSSPRLNQDIEAVIADSDIIIFGPGDLYTSTIPNLLFPSLRQMISKSKANKTLVVNITNKGGEAPNYSVKDFVHTIEKYLDPAGIDIVIANNFVEADDPELIDAMKQKTFWGDFILALLEDRQYLRDKKVTLLEENLFNDSNYTIYNMPKLAQLIAERVGK